MKAILLSPFSTFLRLSVNFLTLLVFILIPEMVRSQVVVTATTDNPHPHGYCDIVTITIGIKNLVATGNFTGRIEYNSYDIVIVDDSDLPSIYLDDTDPTQVFLYFDAGNIPYNTFKYFEYKVKINDYHAFSYNTKNRAYPTASPTNYGQEYLDLSGSISHSPIFGVSYASEIMDEVATLNLILSLLPVTPLPGQSNLYACNPATKQSIYIDNLLIFDIPTYCFYNNGGSGGIAFGNGAQIRVESGSSLSIDNMTLASCDKMWKGIYVEKGGQLFLNNCQIVNAQYGIQAERGSKVWANGTIFQDNYVGLYVSPFQYAADPNHPEDSYVNIENFCANTFIGSGSLLPPYTGQIPTPGDLPFAGIEVNYLSSFVLPGTTSGGSSSANAFENLSNGIIARNTSLCVGDAYFKDIEYDPQLFLKTQGYGIYILDGKYSKIEGNTQGFFPPYYSFHFENCDVGIYNSKGAIDVIGMTMNNVKEGIHVTNVKNGKIYIQDNTIYGSGKGILLHHCVPSKEGKIQYNTIDINGDGELASCIEMNDYPIPTHWNVAHNEIVLHDGKYAIINRSGDETIIMNNTISVDPYTEDDANGIFLDGTKHAIVTCNAIDGDIEPEEENYHLSNGIFFQGANSFNISCNEVSNFRFGIHASSMNSGGSLLRGNTIGEQWDGLFLGSSAVIGSQPPNPDADKFPANIWIANPSDYYDFAAVHAGTAEIVALSPIYYDYNDNALFLPPSIDASAKWFYRDSGEPFLCEEDPTCPEGIGNLVPSWDSLDIKLIAGDLGFSNFDRPLSWMGRFYTYRRLHNLPNITTPTAITTFLSNQQSLNIGKFSNSFDSLHYALKYYGSLESVLEQFPSNLSRIFTRINYLDSLLYTGRFNRDSISEIITERYDSIFLYERNFLMKDSIINSKLSVKIENAIDYIEAISPDSSWQEMLQFTLLEYLHLAKTDTLLSSTDLYDLALSCPDRYGDPVYHARSLIRVDSTINYFDDDNLCSYISPRSVSQEVHPLSSLFPNPADNYINITAIHEILHLQVFTVSGISIPVTSQISGNAAIVDVSNIPSGIYYIRSIGKFGNMEVFKFSIVR